MRHAFVVPELGIHLEVLALKARRVGVVAELGIYELVCTVPGHESMAGTLVVEG